MGGVFIILSACLEELWAALTSACMGICVTGDAVCLVPAGTVTSSVLTSTGSACVCADQTTMHKLAPAPALHALHWFLLESARAGLEPTHRYAIPDTKVSIINISA